MFRASVQSFLEAEVVPHYADWEEAGYTPRDIWLRAGEMGLLGTGIPEEYGGSGGDFLWDAIVIEELGRYGLAAPAWDMHGHIIAPMIAAHGTGEQKRRILPAMAAGESIFCIGLTEPGGGSDLAALRTRATADGQWLSGERLQDLHYQRPHRRLHSPGGEPASGPRRERDIPVPRAARFGRCHPRPESEEDRQQGAGHRRTLLRRRPVAGIGAARRFGAGLEPADARPGTRTDGHRRPVHGDRRGSRSNRPSPTPRIEPPSASGSSIFRTPSSSSPNWRRPAPPRAPSSTG